MPFSKIARTDTAPKRVEESSFLFLDRSARPEIERVRSYLSEVLSRYPASDRDELIARLRAGDEQDFRSATFELFLHEGLIRLGYQVSCHPDPGTGSPKRPDFLVRDSAGDEFFLEAVLASEENGSNPAAEAMKEATLGRLDAAPHQAFMLDVSSEGDPRTQPSSKDLIRRVHKWLDTLDPHALRACLTDVGPDAMPAISWTHEDWELTLRALPLSEERSGRSSRLIGISGGEARIVNTWAPLRRAVKKKATRYGTVTKPYVVAVNAGVLRLDEIDEVQALYGEEYYSIKMIDGEGSGELLRRPNGAWMGPNGPENCRVSAVWIFSELTPYTLASCKSTLYVNPWANIPPPTRLQSMPTKKIEGETLVSIPGTDLATLYGLPEGWPE